MEGGSANDYDYVSGDPVNGSDLTGMAKCLKQLWKQSGGGYTFTVCRVATSAKDLARGFVRIQVDLRPDKLRAAEFVASGVRICGGNPAVNKNCSNDKTPTTNPFQTVSHTRRLVRVGEDWYAFGAAVGLDRDVRTFWAHGQVTSDLLDR